MSFIVANITLADFKAQFVRDFLYLPIYNNTTIYKLNNVVFYLDIFYKCIVATSVGILPTDINNWVVITDDKNNYILDEDITRAFLEAEVNFNPAIFEDERFCKLAYLYLTAHYMVTDIRSGGVDSQGNFSMNSRSVGSVSENYDIPSWVSSNPFLSFFATTYYGIKYVTLAVPRTIGRAGLVPGKTTA